MIVTGIPKVEIKAPTAYVPPQAKGPDQLMTGDEKLVMMSTSKSIFSIINNIMLVLLLLLWLLVSLLLLVLCSVHYYLL